MLKNCDNQFKFGLFRNITSKLHRSNQNKPQDLLIKTNSGNRVL